jgi:N-acetylneuraminic acid mutarotase
MVGVFVVGAIAGWVLTSDGGQVNEAPIDSAVSLAEVSPHVEGSVVIGDGFTATVESAFSDDAGVWFAVALSAETGSGVEQVDGFIGGSWSLESGGSVQPHLAEYFNPLYPGLFSVHFPSPEVSANATLRLRPHIESTRVTKTWSVTFDGLPWSGQPTAPVVEIVDGIDLVVDAVSVDENGVSVQWHLDGPDDILGSFALSAALLQENRELMIVRPDLTNDEFPWGFATSPNPPGYIAQPLRQPAVQTLGELTVPFYTGTELHPEKEYTVKVTLTGSAVRTASEEIVIPIDRALAALQSQPFPEVAATVPPTSTPLATTSPPDGTNGAMTPTGRDHELVLFGGVNNNGPVGETWVYDVNSDAWADVSNDTGPSARADHAMVYVPTIDKVVLFGGTAGFGGCDSNPTCHDRILGDLWMWDPDTHGWEEVSTNDGPQARRGTAIVYDNASDRLILFGGEEAISDTDNQYLNDTWTLDPATMEWTEMGTARAPSPRARHGMLYDPTGDRTLVFGGQSPSQDDDDRIWSLRTGATRWEPVETSLGPSPRWGFNLEYDPGSRSAFLVGGAGTRFTEIAGGTKASATFFTDTWRYDTLTNLWTELSPTGDGGTWIRRTSALDPTTSTLVTFGGQAFNGPQTAPGAFATNRTYRLNLTTLEWQ